MEVNDSELICMGNVIQSVNFRCHWPGSLITTRGKSLPAAQACSPAFKM